MGAYRNYELVQRPVIMRNISGTNSYSSLSGLLDGPLRGGAVKQVTSEASTGRASNVS